jgi:hypothetical protein
VIRQGAHFWIDRFAEMGDDRGVNPIRLGQLPDRTSKVTHLPWIDHDHRQLRND